jgi:hypothetical protein
MNTLQIVSLVLDIILIILGLLTYVRRPKMGGQLARGIQILLIGLILLGFTHMLETGLFVLLQLDEDWNEVIHRVLVMVGFGFVLWGFRRMQTALDN